MAITRSGMRKQIIENLSQVAPPGEQFMACLHGMTGPSPWFDNAIIQALRKYYFVTLTNTSVVVNRAGRLANRPKEVVAAIPLQARPVAQVKKGVLWNKLYIQFPGMPKPTRINVHRIWNADLDRFMALSQAPGQVPPQGQFPQQQQPYPPQGQVPQQPPQQYGR
ncbi:MAG TPA: hypothetical protein VGM10_33565 [Actinocrinis sp.]|jgi:hypothetical protein